ncbi:MAG: hypothetical protein R3Y22_04840 [Bacteroidales bacterium]
MRTSTNNIKYGDKIFATITSHNGKVIANLTIDNINSTKELMLKVRELTYGNHIRLSNLFIRNFTQGWSFNQPLLST